MKRINIKLIQKNDSFYFDQDISYIGLGYDFITYLDFDIYL